MVFGDKKWLEDIYKDNSRVMTIIKCSQVHITEHALCALFTFAQQGLRGMYVLPSKEHRRTFVKDRIDRMKDHSPLYANAIKMFPGEGDSNVYKTIFKSGWKFVGSNVVTDFYEFPCDVLLFDEYDKLVQSNIPYAYDRIQDSQHQVVWKFGNPTYSGQGIHAEYLDTDQKEWHVPCEHCGHTQVLEWHTHFVTEDDHGKWHLRNEEGNPICEACDRPFNRLNTGEWVAQNPGAAASGYRISRLFVRKAVTRNGDILMLFKRFVKAQGNASALQNFYNNYLGVCYEHSEDKITEATLAQCMWGSTTEFWPRDEKDEPIQLRAVMGVDQGKHFTCVISVVLDGELYDIHYANVARWDDVAALEETFNVVCTVVDANGGGYAETRDFVRAKGNRWMCYYRPKDQVKQLYDPNYNECVINTNRTEICDAMVQLLKQRRAHVPRDFRTRDGSRFFKQMLVPNRVIDVGGRPVWTKGADHYFHASAYRTLAWKMSGIGDSRLTKRSWKSKVNKDAMAGNAKEPKAQVLGAQPAAAATDTPKKRSWRA